MAEKEANARIEELWKQHPEGTTQLTLTARDEPRLTTVLKRGVNENKLHVHLNLHRRSNAPMLSSC